MERRKTWLTEARRVAEKYPRSYGAIDAITFKLLFRTRYRTKFRLEERRLTKARNRRAYAVFQPKDSVNRCFLVLGETSLEDVAH